MPQKNKLSLTIQHVDASLATVLTRPLLRRWVHAALMAPAELTLRFVGIEEGCNLNRDYRGKNYATNVLTFAYADDVPTNDLEPVRADIVLCNEVLRREALEQHKPVLDHAAHLVVHGVLHAQGYDHEDEFDAQEMEAIETKILTKLGMPDPYLTRSLIAGQSDIDNPPDPG
ncbi:MAG: rRNA maturation RNase YbeY [Pseudomonadota bacterium]